MLQHLSNRWSHLPTVPLTSIYIRSHVIGNQYYTYILANPLKEGRYFYVGVSRREERLAEHLRCSDTSDKNEHKKNTIKQIQSSGLEVIFIKVLEKVDKQTAVEEEIRLISLYGRRDLGTGILTNMTDGGDGCSGYKRKLEDLVGNEYNFLMVMRLSDKKRKDRLWECLCVCGNFTDVRGIDLKNNHTKSCGCRKNELVSDKNKTHGMSKSLEFYVWQNMFRENPKNVCGRWKESFNNFLEDMGYKPSDKSCLILLDRNKKYSTYNCKWGTRTESCRYKKNIKLITIDGQTYTITEWSGISGTKYATIRKRLKLGWCEKEAVYGKQKLDKRVRNIV